ncbi:MAG: superinfection immunity protein [bacterium]
MINRFILFCLLILTVPFFACNGIGVNGDKNITFSTIGSSAGKTNGPSSVIKHTEASKKVSKKAVKEDSKEWYDSEIFIISAIALGAAIVLFLYALPTIIMVRRGQNYGFFLLVNIIFGFTGVIWIVLLVIALTAKNLTAVNTKQQA